MKMSGKLHINGQTNNSGSAIITVVVAMLFIIALGSSLLYAAYIGYTVSLTERGEKDNFYSADAAMNQIITGVQGLVSDSLVSAYTETLTEYAKGAESSPQKRLSEELIKNLSQTPVFLTSGDRLSFSTFALAGFLSGTPDASGDTVTVSLNGSTVNLSGDGIVQKSIDDNGFGYLTLKGIRMLFTSANGYETTISTDIKISIPEFFTAAASYADAGDYAVIAEKGLHSSTGSRESSVSGNVFVGGDGISLDGGDNSLSFYEGNVCAKGGIQLENYGKLKFLASDKELWTDHIVLGSNGTHCTIELDGKIYVADDLVFEGKNSSAKLTGEYYGFGSGSDTNASSAILINAQESSLDLSALERLSLAGVSYINLKGSGADYSTPIIMGQSIATKADQLAYLLPPECMSNYFSNPCVLELNENGQIEEPVKWESNPVLWTINGTEKTLKDYLGNTGEKGRVMPLHFPANDSSEGSRQVIAYVFIVFTDRNAANEYFKDYFTTYPQRIEQYANLYFEHLSDKAQNVSAAGNTFYSEDGDKLTLYAADTTVFTGNMSTRYENKKSPLDKYVYRDKLDALGSNSELSFKIGDGEVAVVADHYSYSGTDSSIKLIIAKNDVTINANFSGMIIAGGKVTLKGANVQVKAEPINPEILDAKIDGTEITLSEFVRGSSGKNSSGNIWDLTKLVFYDNWKKN